MSRILILGAAGRIGRVAADAFRDAGWSVGSLVRGSSAENAAPGTDIIEIDARDAESVAEAARGADVILHALNPPYVDWATQAVPLADAAIGAARRSGATLMLPGNVYNYGASMPGLIDENTPMQPTSRKGEIRVEIERRMRAAADDGVRSIVLRAGDFYGGDLGGSWFDRVIVRYLAQGRVTYPGPLDVVHPWAYLPDLAAALVTLAEARAKFAPYESFGFPGHAVTGREMTRAIARARGRDLRVSGMPWWMLRALAPIVPTFRELSEMAYLWQRPHRISGDRLHAAVGQTPETPFETAVVEALRAIGFATR